MLAAVQTATRNYDGHGAKYRAWFTYDDTDFFTPQFPSAQPHYNAKVSLERAIPEQPGFYLILSSNVPGVYTPNGCEEDSLFEIFRAIERSNGVSPSVAMSAGTLGKAMHFSDVTTNSVIRNVLYTTWTNVPPEFAGQTNPPSVVGYCIVDWLLQSEWIIDPSIAWDANEHADTNRFTSNLVARIVYRGVDQSIVLERVPITNIVHKWRWPAKLYEQ
jgi:hypothetical protein